MPEIALAGCTPEPLMSYLKALGVFRLVAEQADPDSRLSWAGGVAQLHGNLDREALEGFFLEKYEPTPIVGPWGAALASTPDLRSLPPEKHWMRSLPRQTPFRV